MSQTNIVQGNLPHCYFETHYEKQHKNISFAVLCLLYSLRKSTKEGEVLANKNFIK